MTSKIMLSDALIQAKLLTETVAKRALKEKVLLNGSKTKDVQLKTQLRYAVALEKQRFLLSFSPEKERWVAQKV